MPVSARPKQAGRVRRHPTPFILVDAARGGPLHRQLYDAIRAAIVSGKLPAGARLPSSRTLAGETGVSRVTVGVAFDQLRAEGYVESRTGSGTFVRAGLPDDALHARRRRHESKTRGKAAGAAMPLPRIPDALVQAHSLPVHQTVPIAFLAGLPALDLFPAMLWSKLGARRWRGAAGEGSRLLNYGNPLGYHPLRRAIAEYVGLARGVRCEPEQVLITAGAQQALDLAARVLLRPGEQAWLEDPGYFGARAAFEAAGADMIPVPVDAEGIDPAAGEALAPRARLAYVSPSHQFPLGVTLSMRRRLALLDWAARAGAWVIEDDYDGEFRYVGRPLASLQGLDADRSAGADAGAAKVNGRVLYVGTFSKTLCPALRLGYVILPPVLVDAFAAAKAASVGHTASVDQAILADFIEEGHYARHVRRMRLIYAERQSALLAAAAAHLSDWVNVRPAPAGMHLVGWLRGEAARRGMSDQTLAEVALAGAVVTTALSSYRLGRPLPSSAHGDGALLFGYAAFDEATIWEGARRLEHALAAHLRGSWRRRRRAGTELTDR